MQVMYLGRAPRTKETLPDFLKWRRVTQHPFVFRRLTGSQRTPGIGASQNLSGEKTIHFILSVYLLISPPFLISLFLISLFLAMNIKRII